jgi:hypothetical protein
MFRTCGNQRSRVRAFTGTRAAIENASNALWLLTPASRKERILRRLLKEAASISMAKSALAETGVRRDGGIQRRKQRILDVADRVGTEHDRLARKFRPTHTDIVKEVGIFTELHDDATNFVHLMWRLCSAVAHGDSWIINFFDMDVLGPTAPGVSAVRITAPTPLLMLASRLRWSLSTGHNNSSHSAARCTDEQQTCAPGAADDCSRSGRSVASLFD